MLQYQVTGMNCGHCVHAVEQAVKEVAPGAEVAVDLAQGKVRVAGTDAAEQVRAAITEAGYAVALLPG